MKSVGTVYLVGAGPGDVGLLTLRGAELLRRADVVVYDALVNPSLLRLAPATATCVLGGRRANETAGDRAAVLQTLIAQARAGKTVVRLKGGDPYVFGRGGEEAEALADAGVPFEVVPGVSSFVAVPNYAGVPVTHRGHSSRLTILTGHGDPTDASATVDWAAEARLPGTKVVLMGTERIGQIAELLIAHGMSPETPIVLSRWGTTGHQQSLEGTLATVGRLVAETGFQPPSVAVIGEVVRLRPKLNWFEHRPLFGQRIVVTRARAQAGPLVKQLSDLGAQVLEIPVVKITAPTNHQDIVDVLLDLHVYDWLVFTSPNGVTAFFDLFFKRFDDLRDLGGCRLAAVGPATAAKLRELHLQVDLTPREALATQMAREFARLGSLENLRICLLRAEVAGAELPRALEDLGAIVDDVAVYRTVAETEDPTGAGTQLLESGADWITFTSGSTVEHFHARFNLPELLRKFPKIQLATIGPETSKALATLGLHPTVEATEHTTEGLVASLLQAVRPAAR